MLCDETAIGLSEERHGANRLPAATAGGTRLMFARAAWLGRSSEENGECENFAEQLDQVEHGRLLWLAFRPFDGGKNALQESFGQTARCYDICNCWLHETLVIHC